MNLRTARIVAVVTGLVGLVLAIATPLLPIRQTAVTVDWPQAGSAAPVTAPLTMYKPLEVDVTVPCALAANTPADRETVLAATTPPPAGDRARTAGLWVTTDADSLTVRSKGTLIQSIPRSELPRCGDLRVTVDMNGATATASGLSEKGDVAGDLRPQVVGVFTDLPADQAGPLPRMSIDVDSRYTSTPSALKGAAIAIGVLSVLISLVALAVLDRAGNRRGKHLLQTRWRAWARFGLADAAVFGSLLVWHVIGAPTSDDGYILGMVKAALHSGYMPEVFRYYDAPYAPFGMPFYVVAWMSELSVSSPWLRLPALLSGIAAWLLLSREVLPRLGLSRRRAPRDHSRALWAAAAVFTLFWLTYNPGLRPEPIVALGTVLTWCCVERTVATRRLAPAGIGLVIAGLTLSAAPTGSFAFAVFLVAAAPLWAAVRAHVKENGYAGSLLPLAAAGASVLYLVFGDHGLVEMLQSTKLLADVGPSEAWHREIIRYEALFQQNPNGSVARRFAMLAMGLSAVIAAVVLLRRRRIPGLASGPARRIAAAIGISTLVMAFNPTKWTHHFGAFATLGAMAAAVAAVAIGPRAIRRPQFRLLTLAAVAGCATLAFESTNGWFYPGNFGIPWGGTEPVIAGIKLANVFAVATVLLLAAALVVHVTGWTPKAPAAAAKLPAFATPVTLVATLIIAMIGATNAASIAVQWPAYSYGLQNIRSLAGDPCGMADSVLVERDATAGVLPALGGSREPLVGAENANFTPNGIASSLNASARGAADLVRTGDADTTPSNTGGTGGGTLSTPGVNGSTAALPFGLDPARVPVVGSRQQGAQRNAKATSSWYALPAGGVDRLLTISAAGQFDPGGLRLEFGTGDTAANRITPAGAVTPLDIGPAPAWRNLRVPADQIPRGATAVRVVARITAPSERTWVAYTPPRAPKLETLNELVADDPTLVDWGAGIGFPCQRQWREYGGIAELPRWRILPERDLAAAATTTWQGGDAGGPLGWSQLLTTAGTVPSYLENDWGRDWGALERYRPLVDAPAAQTVQSTHTRSGFWTPGATPAG
ncbi:arabinosyltransferase domain-containing protein [Tsukamurella sp. 1534]|uniref:arabinosyltransferase domain-containing protein n=1 Tax=Tsukamurella sp. 1534 TaxID=1151061 RepID=UPI0002F121FD|nr:arabinosyltransferase domain-containing protein [Tsukamurella sp. 1534]